MTTPNFQQDLISEIFGQKPELAFLGYLGQAGLGQGQERFLRGRASDFLDRLQQAVGQQLVQGGLTTITPEQFFGGLNYKQELGQFTPEQRGMGTSRFAPPTRFLFNK